MIVVMWWYVAGLAVAALGVPTAFTFPEALAALLGVTVFCLLLIKQGLWRTMITLSIVASVLRSSEYGTLLSVNVWYWLQFVPLLIATASALTKPRRPRSRTDVAILALLFAYVGSTVVSSLASAYPAESLAQSGLFAVVAVFLAVAYKHRWTSHAVIRGDLSIIFWTVCALQTAGLFMALAGIGGFDPDYGRYIGLFSNANYAGIMSAATIALGAFLLAGSRARGVYVTAMAPLALAMLMSGSRGALLALGSGVLALLLSQGSRRLVLPTILSLGGLGLIALLARPDLAVRAQEFFVRDAGADITSGRIKIYADVIEQFQTSPIIGTGYRTSELAAGAAAHNVYLSVLAETGLVGAAIFALLIYSIVKASKAGSWHRPLVGGAVVVAVMELTESSVFGFGGPTALSAWIIVLCFAAWGEARATPSPKACQIPDSTNTLSGRIDPSAHANVRVNSLQEAK